MVVHPPPRIKVGNSLCQPEHDQKRAIKPFGCFCIDMANDAPNPVVPQRYHLVRHDLRANEKAVGRFGLYHRPEWQSFLKVRRNWTNENGRQLFVEIVGLDDHPGPRSSQLTWNDRQHDVAAFHFQSLQS
jgi:hypothetical protein